MNQETAERIRDLFTAALDQPAASRLGFVRAAADGDSSLYDQVAQLLALHEEMEGLELPSPADGDRLVGARIGAYEVVRFLGAGGMGRVYLARRADDLFTREVAIKIVDRDGDDEDGRGDERRRFDQERRIHASLRHPGIASLLDAGHTASGLLYFVMEYVDGRPINGHCEERSLGRRARVDLFVQVCDAVAHAHRHLVVHRDLKPANILVDAEGQPKLLDFGIAKPLTRAHVDLDPTRPVFLRATPGYSSPEHLAGRPAHTSMDVYALGIVLSELLEGTVGPRDRDLDAIVARAAHQEPRERYPSAEALAADLRAWLSHQPVAARHGGPAYRLGKLIRRHGRLAAAIGVAAAAVIAATGVLARLWVVEQAGRARADRQIAAAGALAGSTLEIDDRLALLEGTTGVRRLLAEALASYLDSIELDADRQGLLDTADAYRRLADIEGSPNGANLGEPERALEHYDRALAILERGLGLFPGDDLFVLRQAETLASRAGVFAAQSEFDRAMVGYRSALALALDLAGRNPLDPEFQDLLGSIHRPIGDVRLAQGDVAGAQEEFERALAIDMATAARFPGREATKRLTALTLMRLGDARAAAGAGADARRHFAEATSLLSELGAERPAGRRLLRDVALGWARLGVETSRTGADGSGEIARAVAILRELSAGDPSDARSRRDLLVALVQYGDAVGRVDERAARAALAEARDLARRASAESPADAQRTRELAVIEARLAGDEVPALDLFAGAPPAALQAGSELPRVGEALEAVARMPRGWQGYLLLFGAHGPAELLDASSAGLAAGVRLAGPAPAQTVLLIARERPLTTDERHRLSEAIAAIPGPRTVAFDSHLVWVDGSTRLESVPTARGTADTSWALAIRERIAALGDVRIAGRTFPIAAAPAR